jgi:phage terminase large subunit
MLAWRLFYLATQKEKQILWYVAPTYRQAKQILWEMLLEIIPGGVIEKKNETELRIMFVNGSRIEVKGADNPDSLRGVRIDFCAFDECAFMERWETVWKVIRPTLVDSVARVWFVSTPNGFNHFKQLAENMTSEGKNIFDPVNHGYHHYTSFDNVHILRSEIENMKVEMDEDAFAQEVLGEFRKLKGLIYKEFDRAIHMIDIPALDNNWTFTRSLDFGFAHKTALVYFAISPDQKEIYGYDGLYVSGFNEAQIADVVRTKDKGLHITYPVADSSQPMSIAELGTHGVVFQPVEKGQDSVKNGIVKVAALLKKRPDTGNPTLRFSKRLNWIADEFERYRWIENKNEKSSVKEIPYKVNDDAVDAIRYFAMSWKEKERVYRPYDRESYGIH